MPTLNVILHGLFAIHERENDMVLFLPEVENIHVFRAGAWLAETQLNRGEISYSLTGVTTGTERFSEASNILVPHREPAENASRDAYATILLPMPKAIASLRAVPIDPATELSGADAVRIQTAVFPTVQVLTYDVPDMDAVKLEGHDWQPSSDPAATIQNLHILSEEEASDKEHALLAFSKSAALLGIDLQLNEPKQVPPFDSARDAPPEGVHPMELEDLVERQSRMRDYGEALRKVFPRYDPATANELDCDVAKDLLDQLMRVWGNQVPFGSRFGACSNLITTG